MSRSMTLVVVAAFLLMGCSGDEGGGSSVVSCELQEQPMDVGYTHWCYEVSTTNLSAQTVDALRAACSAIATGSTTGNSVGAVRWSTGSCPAVSGGANRVGTCAVPSTNASASPIPYWYGGLPNGTPLRVSWYSPPVSAATGASICTTWNGTWSQ